MRVVVDTNIVFSAILNTQSKISQIIPHPKTRLNFYSTNQLNEEIEEHKNKIQEISKYSDLLFKRLRTVFI
jgi:predicted nucleic acid-binding protein